ncbi:MAG TPA: signal peptide peptidase SppA [Xanthobacteraceae bacterium]
MSLEADQIVDRRNIRRKLTFWRVIAALVAIAAVITVAMATSGRTGFARTTAGSIARVTISGLIRSNQERVEALDRLGRSATQAVIVHINSPGGTTAGAEELHAALLRLKAKKPLVVVVDGLAASGGYITAIASDHIVSLETSLVGSIGVLVQYPNVSELMQTLGIKVESIRSSPLKAAPSGYEPTNPEATEAMRAVVLDSYAWFRGMVKDRRGFDDAALEKVADGRVFTGRQALGLKLVDELGNEQTALAWLAREKKIDAQTPVRDYSLQSSLGDLSFLRLVALALDAVGLSSFGRQVAAWSALQTIESLNLDGVLALWHPRATN